MTVIQQLQKQKGMFKVITAGLLLKYSHPLCLVVIGSRTPKTQGCSGLLYKRRKLKHLWVSCLWIQPMEDQNQSFRYILGNPLKPGADCNSSIEREFTYPLHSLKLCSSLVFNVFTVVQPSLLSISEHFIAPQRSPAAVKSHSSAPSLWQLLVYFVYGFAFSVHFM